MSLRRDDEVTGQTVDREEPKPGGRPGGRGAQRKLVVTGNIVVPPSVYPWERQLLAGTVAEVLNQALVEAGVEEADAA